MKHLTVQVLGVGCCDQVVPAALESAIASDPEFREGIPWDFLDNHGVVYSTDETPKRKQIADKIRRLFAKLFDHAPIDAAADQIAKELIHESLPPMLQSSEKHFHLKKVKQFQGFSVARQIRKFILVRKLGEKVGKVIFLPNCRKSLFYFIITVFVHV